MKKTRQGETCVGESPPEKELCGSRRYAKMEQPEAKETWRDQSIDNAMAAIRRGYATTEQPENRSPNKKKAARSKSYTRTEQPEPEQSRRNQREAPRARGKQLEQKTNVPHSEISVAEAIVSCMVSIAATLGSVKVELQALDTGSGKLVESGYLLVSLECFRFWSTSLEI